ncbi:hypothetical protein Ahia01_001102300 [Argonauta hians]
MSLPESIPVKFVNETINQINIESTWGRERDCVESGNQTVPFSVKDSSVQSQTKQAKGNQTERPMEITVPAVQEDSPALAAFLKKMEPHVYRELEKNSKTQAFQGYQVSWQEESCSVDKMHTFTHGPFEDQLQVTGLSWNCSGSVIAASYGRFDHDSWCTHKSGLCTWNIDSQSVDPRKAGKVIEQSCCLMCVAFHPTNPALICGGNFNGEIMLWDFSPNDVLLLDTCSIGDDHSHREPVAKLQWVVDPSNAKLYNLVSVSGDGKLLVWNVDTKLNTMSIMKQFAITSQSLPRTLRGKGSRLDREVGLTCLSFSHYDDNTCFTGSETGAIFKCSTERNGCGDADMISRLPLPSPVVLTYKPHLGPVNAIDCSPFHPHVFLTSGMDHSMKIWNALQMEPVKTLEPGQGSVLCGQWSPVRPMVIAATTDTGCLLLYDLQNSWVKPLHALDVASDKSPLYSLSFNSLCVLLERDMTKFVVNCGLTTLLLLLSLNYDHGIVDALDKGDPFTAKEWADHAQKSLEAILNRVPKTGRAKNIILFIGDGMGLPTIAATRILKGQLKGVYEIPLAFEKFPYVALSKTHSADRQVADSASTATAYLCGAKTNFGMSGMAATYDFGKCTNDSSYHDNKLDSILKLAHDAGKATGIVTTTRLTHASPSACYVHIADRDWESDYDMASVKGSCSDIAKQLIDENSYIQVLMGGGRYKFLPQNYTDEEKKEVITKGRLDKRNLVEDWKKHKADNKLKHKYVWNKGQFDSINPAETDYVLGLFEPSHMQYDIDRDNSSKGEPSLAEMVEKAIKILKRDKDGFFLFVEGGKIDSAHHDILAKKALYEGLGLDKAVEKAVSMVDLDETLVIVTADHSISFATLGYGTRKNPILGLVDRIAWGGAKDGKPYASLVYASGLNYPCKDRQDLHKVDTADKEYKPQVGVPMEYSAHTGEDVAIYATGPWSHLYDGVQEESNIHHFMAYAACISKTKPNAPHCNSAITAALPSHLMLLATLMVVALLHLLHHH